MQVLHTSRCDPGTLLQQWLGAQISSKTPLGINALSLGSLNPAPVPDPICLMVGMVQLCRGGAQVNLSARPCCNGTWGGWRGWGWARVLPQHRRAGPGLWCGCTLLCQGTWHPQASAAPVMGTQPLVSGLLLPSVKNGLG